MEEHGRNMPSSIFNSDVLRGLRRVPVRRWAWVASLLAGAVLTYGWAAYQSFRFDMYGRITPTSST